MVGAVGVIALLLALAGLSTYGVIKPAETFAKDVPPGWRHGHGGHGYTQTPVSVTGLSETEKEAILYMVEEEKLARDVYMALYEKWGLQIFANIARSEQQHMDAVRSLINKYGLADPTLSLASGEFTNPELQNLYNELVARGYQSPEEALKVGALIEELDIYDLENWLQKVQNPDVRRVFCNLEKGSRNHLRSFYKELQTMGATYTPVYISHTMFQKIVSGDYERGSAC